MDDVVVEFAMIKEVEDLRKEEGGRKIKEELGWEEIENEKCDGKRN